MQCHRDHTPSSPSWHAQGPAFAKFGLPEETRLQHRCSLSPPGLPPRGSCRLERLLPAAACAVAVPAGHLLLRASQGPGERQVGRGVRSPSWASLCPRARLRAAGGWLHPCCRELVNTLPCLDLLLPASACVVEVWGRPRAETKTRPFVTDSFPWRQNIP